MVIEGYDADVYVVFLFTTVSSQIEVFVKTKESKCKNGSIMKATEWTTICSETSL